ncbi:MAG: glycosyltransferase family 2 protein, partial [Pseudomonadota bacterium]
MTRAAAGAAPLFTILLPLIRPPVCLPHAVDTVLRQTERDFELFIVCDGAPEETVAWAEDAARDDRRIKVRAFAKGEALGEAHRAEVMREATGRLVAGVADDDAWLDDHLETLARQLRRADLTHTLRVKIDGEGRYNAPPGRYDIADPAVRRMMMETRNTPFGPTFAGWRRTAYDALPHGWRPAPKGMATDLHMWRQFIETPGLTFSSGLRYTAIKLQSGPRRAEGWTLARRGAESALYAAAARDPARAARMRLAAYLATAEGYDRAGLLRVAAKDPAAAA